MSGISRANHTNPHLGEGVGNETPTRSPDASGNSSPTSGRRESHVLLDSLAPFRRTSSPPPEQRDVEEDGSERQGFSGAATPPRASLPQISRSLSAAELHQQGEQPSAATPPLTPAFHHNEEGIALVDPLMRPRLYIAASHPMRAPSALESPTAIRRTESTQNRADVPAQAVGGAGLLPPEIPRSSMPEVNDLLQQLWLVGVDTTEAHRMISAAMNQRVVFMNPSLMAILRPRFPTIAREGLDRNDPVVAALHEALAERAFSESWAATHPPDFGPIRTSQAFTGRALVTPERDPGETNDGEYAWRIYNQNPHAPADEVADEVARSGGDYQRAMLGLRRCIHGAYEIFTQFSRLRPISRADAARMGFKDAAIYNREGDGVFSKELATRCLFGEELSLTNANQQVIGLAQIPSTTPTGYAQDINKNVVFMDMRKLAMYLVINPKHPMNNMPLNADNIADFAFKIL